MERRDRLSARDTFPEFSARFSALLESSGLQKNILAHNLGISRQTISRYANGEASPDLIYAVTIARYFHVTVDWLLGLTALDGQPAARDTYEILEEYNRASEEDREEIRRILWKYRDTLGSAVMDGMPLPGQNT